MICRCGAKLVLKIQMLLPLGPRDLEQNAMSHPRGETMVIKWFLDLWVLLSCLFATFSDYLITLTALWAKLLTFGEQGYVKQNWIMKTIFQLALAFLYFCLSFSSKEPFTSSYSAGMSWCLQTPNNQHTPRNNKGSYFPSLVLPQSFETHSVMERSKTKKYPKWSFEENYDAHLTPLKFS